jgi:DNA-directed RNA polymerase subunit RPC12/RpoP
MRRYKTSYKSRRGVKRFSVSFGESKSADRKSHCLNCGTKIEEVMTVDYCFRCWNSPEMLEKRKIK